MNSIIQQFDYFGFYPKLSRLFLTPHKMELHEYRNIKWKMHNWNPLKWCAFSPYFNNKQRSPVYKNHTLQCTQFKCGDFKWNETKRTNNFLWWAQSINSLLLRLFYSNLWKFLFRWNFLSRLKWYLSSILGRFYLHMQRFQNMHAIWWMSALYSESVALNVQTISLKLRNHGKFPRTHYLNKVQATHYYSNRTFNSELFWNANCFPVALSCSVVSYAYIRLTIHNFIEIASTFS